MGLLARLVALPLDMVSAFYLTKLIGGFLNFDLTEFRISPARLKYKRDIFQVVLVA